MRHICIVILLLTSSRAECQESLQRIEADFTIKENSSDGTKRLTIGKVFYDRKERAIIYDISFPENIKMVFLDSMLIYVRQDTLEIKPSVPAAVSYSIFNLSLHGDLQYFGLNKSGYKLKDIDKLEDKVVSTWMMPPPYDEYTGPIKLSQKSNLLDGMVSYSIYDEIIARQFFRDYVDLDVIQFPQRVIEITYLEQIENKKLTTYRNIKLNEKENPDKYSFDIDRYRSGIANK